MKIHANPFVPSRLLDQFIVKPFESIVKMPGVNVRDVEVSIPIVLSPLSINKCSQAPKFIDAYAAFLKRQGKLPIPGPTSPARSPTLREHPS